MRDTVCDDNDACGEAVGGGGDTDEDGVEDEDETECGMKMARPARSRLGKTRTFEGSDAVLPSPFSISCVMRSISLVSFFSFAFISIARRRFELGASVED